MWKRLGFKDFDRPLRTSGAYDAVSAQATIDQVNALLDSQFHISSPDARAVQMVRRQIIIETAQATVSAELRLIEPALVQALKAAGIRVAGIRVRPPRGRPGPQSEGR